MSLLDVDRMPRMVDTMTADDLNLDGCIALTSTILREAANDYLHARRTTNREPWNTATAAHLAECRRFYRSDYFTALSNGLMDAETVMAELDKQARRG